MKYDNAGNRVSTVTQKGIYGFFNEYRFLSNFYPCQVSIDGLKFSSSEAAYMSFKTNNRELKEKFQSLSPSLAKKLGRKVQLVENWDQFKIIVMTRVVAGKFKQNPELLKKLKETGDLYLEETNDWGDRIWGADQIGKGENYLGLILMLVRGML